MCMGDPSGCEWDPVEEIRPCSMIVQCSVLFAQSPQTMVLSFDDRFARDYALGKLGSQFVTQCMHAARSSFVL